MIFSKVDVIRSSLNIKPRNCITFKMAVHSEVEVKLSFYDIWEDFTETTGFHAVNKMSFGVKNRPLVRTIIWMIFWLMSAGYLIYTVTIEISTYYKYPLSTSVTVQLSEELEFPVITLCSMAPRKKSAISGDERTDNYYLGLSSLEPYMIAINWSDPFYTTEGYFQERTMDNLYNESKDTMKMLQRHSFDLEDMNMNFTTVATDLGLCLRGNLHNTLSTRLSGGLYNLQFYLDLNLTEDYYAFGHLSSGVKIAVHNKNDEPLMVNDGIAVPPASEAFVQIHRLQHKLLPHPYKAFGDATCKEMPSEYSTSKCFMKCLEEETRKTCGCVDFMFESPNGKYCSKERHMTCFMPSFWNVLRGGINCDCPDPCDAVSYDTSLSFGKFPSEFTGIPLAKLLNRSVDYVMSNYVNIKIFYKKLETTITEQTPKYATYGDVFSNIGGQMGLFLGASILTVLELGEFILFAGWYLLVLLTRRNVMVSNGNRLRLNKQNVVTVKK